MTSGPAQDHRKPWRFTWMPRGAQAWLALAVMLSPLLVAAAREPWGVYALAVLWLPVGLVMLGTAYVIGELITRDVLPWWYASDATVAVVYGLMGVVVALTYVVAAHFWAWLLVQVGGLAVRVLRGRRAPGG